MAPRKKQRPNRKQRLTPKGEARGVLEQAADCLRDLGNQRTTRNQNAFIRKLNEFLMTARKVSEFLPKESGRGAALRRWFEKEHGTMLADPRYAHFFNLRRVSSHDCSVRPDSAHQAIEIANEIRLIGNVEIELLDAETGQTTGRASYVAPVGAESVHREARVRTTYWFADWPNEDIVTFCRQILARLGTLVADAYHLVP